MKKCKYLKENGDAESRARGAAFPRDFLLHLPDLRAESVLSLATFTPLWPTQIHSPSLGRAAPRAPLEGQQTPGVLDSCALTPLYVSMVWGELGCCPAAAQGPGSLEPSPRCSWAQPLALPATPSKTQAPFTPCSCAVPASQSKQQKPVRWGFPKYWACMAAFSAAAPWRGHPRAASPENTISVHQSEQGHQGITGAGLKGKQEGSIPPAGWAGHFLSFPAAPIFPWWGGPAWGPCATFQVWPSPLQRVEPSSRMLWMAVLLQWCLTALPRSQQCWEFWGKLIMLLFI